MKMQMKSRRRRKSGGRKKTKVMLKENENNLIKRMMFVCQRSQELGQERKVAKYRQPGVLVLHVALSMYS